MAMMMTLTIGSDGVHVTPTLVADKSEFTDDFIPLECTWMKSMRINISSLSLLLLLIGIDVLLMSCPDHNPTRPARTGYNN